MNLVLISSLFSTGGYFNGRTCTLHTLDGDTEFGYAPIRNGIHLLQLETVHDIYSPSRDTIANTATIDVTKGAIEDVTEGAADGAADDATDVTDVTDPAADAVTDAAVDVKEAVETGLVDPYKTLLKGATAET